MRGTTLLLAFWLAAPVATADTAATWRLFDAKLSAACPSHHVELICGDCQLELIEGYEASLPVALARRAVAVADTKHACAAETLGFDCEYGQSLVAYRRLGLLDRFVTYSCRNVTCEEGAVCSRFPRALP